MLLVYILKYCSVQIAATAFFQLQVNPFTDLFSAFDRAFLMSHRELLAPLFQGRSTLYHRKGVSDTKKYCVVFYNNMVVKGSVISPFLSKMFFKVTCFIFSVLNLYLCHSLTVIAIL